MSGIATGGTSLYFAGNGEYTGTGVYDTLPPTAAKRDRKITIKAGTNDEEFKHVSLFGPNFRFTDIPLRKVRDIAYDEVNNMIWLATNATGDPIRSFNTQAQVVSTISSSIGIGSDICGLTMATMDDHRILWASDLSTDKIYKIDLDYTTSINNHVKSDAVYLPGIVCQVDNVSKKVIIENRNITGGDRNISLTLYTMQGDEVFCTTFSNRYIWNGNSQAGKQLSRGIYLAQIKAVNSEKHLAIHKMW